MSHSDHEHHDHSCSCGCSHDHSHSEHEHNHDHHDHSCSCGCSHDHPHSEHGHEHHHELRSAKAVFLLENLGCANCAAKMERRINELPEVEAATITFATRQLRLNAKDPEKLLPQIQTICASIESQVKVVPAKSRSAAASRRHAAHHEHDHHNHDHCTHEHRDHCQHHHHEHVHCEHNHHAHDHCEHDHHDHEHCEHDHHEHEHCTHEHHTHDHHDHHCKETFFHKYSDSLAIAAGAVLFLVGVILGKLAFSEWITLPFFIIAYLILGGPVLLEAVQNISHGQVFDENFLMSIATIGAFAIREYPEAVGVMLFYRIGEFFEHKAVERSRGQIMEAIDMRPETVNLLSGTEVTVISAEEAEPDDILLIRPGDRIPLDGVIVEGSSRIDTSPITGEPVPVTVHAGDSVTSGCVNTSGQLKMRVVKPLSESMVSRILDSVENAAASKPKIDRFITRFSRIYTPCVVFGALAVAVIPSLVTGNWTYWIYTALTFLVMSCPCALVLSVPLAFFSGIGTGSKRGILFKGGLSIEALSQIKTVVMDKTGTITEGNFTLQKVIPSGNWSVDELLRICAGCEQNSSHPIAHSITAAAAEKQLSPDVPTSLEEIAGHGILAQLPEGQVLCGNHKLMDRYGIQLPLLSEESYGTEVHLAINGVYAGSLLISDTIKSDAQSAISRLHAMGLHTVMLTGDSEPGANAVAAATGIQEVHAKLLPQDKLAQLGAVREKNGSVMFVGDGINDAPVLAGADVGAAMGSGADAAIEAADAVFMNAAVSSIPDSIAIARETNRIAIQNVVFALAIKLAVMLLGLFGFANMWMAVFADSGVAMLCVLNSIRILYKKNISR